MAKKNPKKLTAFLEASEVYYKMLRTDMATPGVPRDKQTMYVPRIHINEAKRNFIKAGAVLFDT